MEYYTTKTGNTILPFAETWMGLKDIMLSKKANTVCFHLQVKFLKNKMNKYNKRKTENKTSAYQTSRERGWGGTKWEKIGVIKWG